MERNEIIKALVCCTVIGRCKDCPYSNKGSPYNDGACGERLLKGTFSIIKELTEENEKLKAQKYMAYPDGRVEMIPNAESVKADTVSNLKARMAIQCGTYTGKDTIPIKELFDVLDKVCEEILDEDHD